MFLEILFYLAVGLGGLLAMGLLVFVMMYLLFGGDADLEREDAWYWAAYDLSCPHCGRDYPPGVRTRVDMCCLWHEEENDPILFDEIEGDVSEEELRMNPSLVEEQSRFACPHCGESATFARLASGPVFLSFEPASRRCLECTELFYGTLESACPVCGEAKSELADRSAIPPDQWRVEAPTAAGDGY